MSKSNVAVSDELKPSERQLSYARVFQGENFQKCLRSVLPRHIPAERMIRVILSAMQTQPKLLECDGQSVILAILRAASLGLEPDGGLLGHGYLVPFWSSKNSRLECQFIAGYRGMIKLAGNSGEVLDVSAEVVYAADEFHYTMGLEPTLKHVRNDDLSEPSALTHAYAIAQFRDGTKKFVVLNRADIEKVKAVSSSKDKKGNLVGPWKDWESEMWRKTAVRRLCKLLPLSVERQTQIKSAVGDEPDGVGDFGMLDLPALAAVSKELPAIEQSEAKDGKLFDSSPSAQEAGV